LGYEGWANALAAANALADGNVACGLADGSIAGDWRLPNRNELASLLDMGMMYPALPADHPFLNFRSGYWSSTTRADNSGQAWFVDLFFANIGSNGKVGGAFVTAVRGGS